jgi:hypothetical protein
MGQEHAEITLLKKKLHFARNGQHIKANFVSRIEEREI